MRIFLTYLLLIVFFQGCSGQDKTQSNSKSKSKKMNTNTMEKATFGGGCFWCVEAVFEQLQGVESVTSGFAGGHKENPSYKEVTEGTTGHAEVIQVVFNSNKIAYDELLDVFWTVHDPTQLNRQGNDVGEHYRSIILYDSEEQKLIAQRSLKEFEASKMYNGNFKTQIVPLEAFYKAESSHQNYYETVGDDNPYCTLVIKPKIDKFYKKFYDKLKPEYK